MLLDALVLGNINIGILADSAGKIKKGEVIFTFGALGIITFVAFIFCMSQIKKYKKSKKIYETNLKKFEEDQKKRFIPVENYHNQQMAQLEKEITEAEQRIKKIKNIKNIMSNAAKTESTVSEIDWLD